MLLNKIELTNFRQFRNNQSIDFATDETKNVTIIMAENGVGKTTLAQAFQWVLYGAVDGFKNKSLLNLKEEKLMAPGQTKTVEVKLNLIHNDIEYNIVRKQLYTKESSGGTRYNNSEIEISYKKDGQVEFIEEYFQKMSTLKTILPQELSKYFFFDGERINRMSSEISNGRSKEFADAVESLLGLRALKDAMEHLNPNSKRSVVGKFNEEIDEQGDQKSREYTQKIDELNEELEKIDERLEDIDEDYRKYSHRRDKLKSDIASCAEAEKLQKQYDTLEREIETSKEMKNEKMRKFIDDFNRRTPVFMQQVPIRKALEELSRTEKIDKGIPDIKDKTIKFLLERKKCVCGADLSDPTCEAVRNLITELEFVPPQSIGLSIRSFVDRSKEKIDGGNTFYKDIQDIYKDIRIYDRQIEEYKNEISKIDKNLLDNNKVNDLKRQQIDCEEQMDRLEREKTNLTMKKGANTQEVEKLSGDRDKLILVNDKNIQLQLNRQYAKTIFEQIAAAYNQSEKATREELQELINSLFKKIYGEGMYIKIDEKYNIKVLINELTDDNGNFMYDIDYSTAQSYSVIFAFIVGIIDMAKKRSKGNSEHLVETEVYPLVMDAPLSAFDEHRITNICSTIPGIARQVIIIIKDTDGNIAKENLQGNIGKEYQIKPRDYSEENNKSVIESYVEEMEVR